MRSSPHALTAMLKVVLMVALLLAAAQVAGTTRFHSQRHYASTQRYEDVYYLPPPAWLGVFSLGHREALAGLIWMRALIYFGDELVHRGSTRNLRNYADAMLTLDPYFARAYRWVATSGVYRAGRVTRADIEQSIAYLERGARLFPDDGEIAWDLAAFYLYELRPHVTGASERSALQQKGLEHMQVAILRGAGPPWLALSAASEFEKMGQREQQIAFLQEAYGQVTSDSVRESIEARLAELQSEAFADALAREHAQAEAARQRDFPYLDMELFLQVGPKPAFDGQMLLLRGFDPVAARTALEPADP